MQPNFIKKGRLYMGDRQKIFGPYYSVTGIRADVSSNVAITGSYKPPNTSQTGFVYVGPLEDTGKGVICFPTPPASWGEIATSIFYGPNTAQFNPGIGSNN